MAFAVNTGGETVGGGCDNSPGSFSCSAGHDVAYYGANATGGNTLFIDEVVNGSVMGSKINTSNDVSGNKITVLNTTVNGSVIGGVAGWNNPGIPVTVYDNTVIIDNSTVTGDAMGGYGSSGGSARDNLLVLRNGAKIMGGASPGKDGTLRIEGAGNTAGLISISGSTGKYQFVMDGVRAGDTMIRIDYAYDTSLNDANFELTGSPGSLGMGEKISLVTNAGAGNIISTLTNTHFSGQGMSLTYDMELGVDATGKSLDLTVVSASISDQTKAVAESRLAGAALINQGMDLASEAGLASAKSSLKGNNNMAVFGAMAGGSSKYNTGSSVKVDGVSLMAGVGRHFTTTNGDLMGGVFFEAGYGDLNTHNSFSTGTVKGSGDSKYYGAGLMARYDVTSTAMKGTYLEGSLHVGRVKTNWDSSDMVGADGKVNNDTSNMYYGLHAGLGYVWNLTNQANLDLYGKYYWSHQGSDSTTVGKDLYHFDSTDSHRTRLGGRLNLNLTETVRPYLGVAWEHEFDGESNAQVYGFDVAAPTLKGDSGIFELGFSFKPVKNDNVTFDLGLQAYTGVREGVAGTAQFNYKF